MFSMTKKTGYGLIAIMHLARLPEGELASAREIARQYGIPLALLMKVLKELCTAGYIASVRGARGGYRLARSPEEVNFVGLMEALERPMKLAECLMKNTDDRQTDSVCTLINKCPIADPVHRIQRRIHDFLTQLTLAEILSDVPAGGSAAK
jgi:Rrf2 family protein